MTKKDQISQMHVVKVLKFWLCSLEESRVMFFTMYIFVLRKVYNQRSKAQENILFCYFATGAQKIFVIKRPPFHFEPPDFSELEKKSQKFLLAFTFFI